MFQQKPSVRVDAQVPDSAPPNSGSSRRSVLEGGHRFGAGELVRTSLDPGSSPVEACLGFLVYTCRESGWGFIPIVALLRLAPALLRCRGGGGRGGGCWGAGSLWCSAGQFVHCLPLSASARTEGSDFSAGHEGKSRLPKTQQDQELLKYSVSAQIMGETAWVVLMATQIP